RGPERRLRASGGQGVSGPTLASNGSSAGHTGGTPAWNTAASARKCRQASPLVRQLSELRPLVRARHELGPAYRPARPPKPVTWVNIIWLLFGAGGAGLWRCQERVFVGEKDELLIYSHCPSQKSIRSKQSPKQSWWEGRARYGSAPHASSPNRVTSQPTLSSISDEDLTVSLCEPLGGVAGRPGAYPRFARGHPTTTDRRISLVAALRSAARRWTRHARSGQEATCHIVGTGWAGHAPQHNGVSKPESLQPAFVSMPFIGYPLKKLQKGNRWSMLP
ncbi:MAG: hypothetical protein LC775_08635, partial [Acidobacteria bacterium]|nr:hypothetical protein [Acidobacteriota bacterium]